MLTPLMRQYWDLKAQAQDSLLLFRMGDFYELFGEDAVEASRILGITLTTRDRNKEDALPMAGVPHHSVGSYLKKLLEAGKKIAICEQLEDPANVQGKAIVQRGIVRFLTPGIQFDLEQTEAHYLGALAWDAKKPNQAVLACMDASTGELLTSEPLGWEELAGEIAVLPVRQLIFLDHPSLAQDEGWQSFQSSFSSRLLVEALAPNTLSREEAQECLRVQYGISDLNAFFTDEYSLFASALAIHYLLKTQKKKRLDHLKPPALLRPPQTLSLGPKTPLHLDLLPTQEGSPNLFQFINRSATAMGARLIKHWMMSPLSTLEPLHERQTAIREWADERASASLAVSQTLQPIYDLERLMGRFNAGLGNPRDALCLGQSLGQIPALLEKTSALKASLNQGLHIQLELLWRHSLQTFAQELLSQFREDAPLSAREGGIFKPGVDPELDRLLTLSQKGERWIVELEKRERDSTGISSLKVKYNRVFGYFIEVTQTHLKNVPPHYLRKQTTAGGERFFTEELKKFEEEILNSEYRLKTLEQSLFEAWSEKIRSQGEALSRAAVLLAQIDALSALAQLSLKRGWNFPTIDSSLDLEIREGRHALLESIQGDRFVPNDLSLGSQNRCLLVTGPNMGGKSTLMRQAALIIILGQMGAPVPARQARWGVVTRLYTRVGAQDAITQGQSTFMVEMSELAHLLSRADSRSFLILDEIGRGTSTYDGMSVAWATLEWICSQIQCRTLFATHYHELTKLEETIPLLGNAHLGVETEAHGKGLRFLYRLESGPALESFGIQVAELAGIPKPVIARAWEVLEQLERSSDAPSFLSKPSLAALPRERLARRRAESSDRKPPPSHEQPSLFEAFPRPE